MPRGVAHDLDARAQAQLLGNTCLARRHRVHAGRRRSGHGDSVRRYHLTRREAEIGALLASGLGTRQAAQQLGITANTVRRHAEHLLDKLGVHSRLAAAARLRGD